MVEPPASSAGHDDASVAPRPQFPQAYFRIEVVFVAGKAEYLGTSGQDRRVGDRVHVPDDEVSSDSPGAQRVQAGVGRADEGELAHARGYRRERRGSAADDEQCGCAGVQ